MQHFTFLMEQTLGHVTFAQNLRPAFEADPAVKVEWLPVTFAPQGRVENLPGLRSNWSLRGSYRARRLIQAERKRSGPPDLYLLHTQVISLLSAGWLPGRTPLVISLDATPLNYDRIGAAYEHRAGSAPLEKFKFWLNRRAFQAASYLVSWSAWAKKSLVEDYGVPEAKIEVLPPGADLDFWQPAIKPARPEGKTRLLFVGGDFERKGGKLLYETFRRYLDGSCELHLVTKGQVSEGPGIFVPRHLSPNSPELQQLFRQADIFVLPTQGDCLPVAIVEALAAGLPVVSSRVGAVEEAVIAGENGFVIDPGDGDSLAQILLQLSVNHELRYQMGTKSRQLAVEHFDAAKNGRRLLEICKQLGAGQPLARPGAALSPAEPGVLSKT